MNDEQFIPIKVSTLRGDLAIPFDVYVRVAGKYIHYCKRGDHFEGERLQRLVKKKLQIMFILKEHAVFYDQYLKQNISNAYDSTLGKPIDIRAEIIQGAQQATIEDLMNHPANQEFYNVAFDGAKKLAEFLQSEDLALQSLLKVPNPENNIAHHSVNVAALALSIADELGFQKTRPMELPTLTLGCLLHDIDDFRAGEKLLILPEDLKASEARKFREHAKRGIELVKEIPFYDKLVKEVIATHEESMDGSGPLGRFENDIDPLVFCAAVANDFDRYVQIKDMPPKEALKKMLIEKMGVYPLNTLQALQATLKKKKIVG